jgi:hypothetical protein
MIFYPSCQAKSTVRPTKYGPRKWFLSQVALIFAPLCGARRKSMTDEGRVTPESQAAAPQAAESVCILEPILPAHLKDSAPDDPDWDAKALEALAKQLTETNDFYHPLLDAARELRDLRSVRASLIELLRTVNPYTKSYPR